MQVSDHQTGGVIGSLVGQVLHRRRLSEGNAGVQCGGNVADVE